MTVQLRHEDGENYRSNHVTVQYDNRTRNLPVQANGIVEVDNKLHAEELQETHGSFEVIDGNEDDLPDYVLENKNVDEVEQYIRDIEDVDRLKELRELEDRKTGKEAIDNRISEVKKQTPTDVEAEEVEQEDENQEQNNESEDEDGTENEK